TPYLLRASHLFVFSPYAHHRALPSFPTRRSSDLRSRKDTAWRNESLDWSAFIKKITTPHRTHETFAEYKEMPKQQRDEIKDIGGFVGGTLQGGRRKADAVKWRSLITLDA